LRNNSRGINSQHVATRNYSCRKNPIVETTILSADACRVGCKKALFRPPKMLIPADPENCPP
jgi:hypothetical protein